MAPNRAPTRAEAAKAEAARLRQDDEARAIRAMDCCGCPYAGCLGATATLTWGQMVARYNEEEEEA